VDSRFYCRGFDFTGFITGVVSSHFLDVGGAMDFVRIRGWLCTFSLCYAIRFGREKTGR
jgi:hypothetical protein